MYWSWTLPWSGTESLLGLLIAEDVDIFEGDSVHTASLVSIGILFGRLDFVYNIKKQEE